MESNPVGQYEAGGFPQPDAPGQGYGLGTNAPGIGCPIIYVLGGRVAANQPVTIQDGDGVTRGLVQKYYVPNYGSDGAPPWDEQYAFQTTGNQTDIWSHDFLRPDTDQWPDSQDNPQIQDRLGDGAGTNAVMPNLPTPLYGEAAVALETGVTTPAPAFPFGTYHYIFVFGGIDDKGAVHKEMRWWDTSRGFQAGQGGNADAQPGVFSSVVDMPRERAYAKAVVIPMGTSAPAVALVGGFDHTGAPIKEIDVFQFSDPHAPNTGSWSTFNGTLPEALLACGAGYNPGGAPSEAWVLAFAGWTGSQFSSATFNARLGSSGLVVREALQVVPRRNLGSAQSGGPILPLDFNRYALLGGVTENGPTSIVEVFGLP
jgi:hypothetical protein